MEKVNKDLRVMIISDGTGETATSLSNCNLDFTMTSNNMYPMSTFTIPKSGKWYVEIVFTLF